MDFHVLPAYATIADEIERLRYIEAFNVGAGITISRCL